MPRINFTCPSCGKKSVLEIPEIQRLRDRVAYLEKQLKDEKDSHTIKDFMDILGMK
jgi:transcription initiation factor IIE alpha subunit